MQKIVGIGDVSIDYFYHIQAWPQEGDKGIAKFIKKDTGGMVANALICLARYGADSILIDTIDAAEQSHIAAKFQEAGLATAGLYVVNEHATTLCSIYISPTERTIMIHPVNYAKRLQPEQRQWLTDSCCIYSTITDLKRYNVLTDIQDKPDVFVAIDVEANNFASYQEDAAYFERANLIFMNEFGLAKLQREKAFEQLLTLPGKIVVLTQGAKGCTVYDQQQMIQIPGEQVEVVDTTGAGDLFNATFVYCYLKTRDAKKAGFIANKAAAESVTKLGNHHVNISLVQGLL